MKTINEITNKIKYEYINAFINPVKSMVPIDDLISFDTTYTKMFSIYGNPKKPYDYYIYVGKDENNYMYFLNYISKVLNNCVGFTNSKFKFCYLIPTEYIEELPGSNIYCSKTQIFPNSSEFVLSMYRVMQPAQFEEYLKVHQNEINRRNK